MYRNNELVTKLLTRHLREFVDSATTYVTVQGGEVILDTHAPPKEIVNECRATVRSGPVKSVVKVQKSSILKSATQISAKDDMWKASLFLGGDIDVTLKAHAHIKTRLGKQFFNRCLTKYRNYFPLHILARGSVWVGAKVFATDVRIEERPPQPGHAQYYEPGKMPETLSYLIFKFQIELNARIKKWSLDHLGIRGCEVKFLGLTIISFCGQIRRTVRDYASRFTRDFSSIHMPNLLDRIERLLHQRVGDEIAIPLLLVDNKQEFVFTLIEKASNVARLKGDLIEDLTVLAGQVAESIG